MSAFSCGRCTAIGGTRPGSSRPPTAPVMWGGRADWVWHVWLANGWPAGFFGNAVQFRRELAVEGLRQMVLEGRDLAREERRRGGGLWR